MHVSCILSSHETLHRSWLHWKKAFLRIDNFWLSVQSSSQISLWCESWLPFSRCIMFITCPKPVKLFPCGAVEFSVDFIFPETSSSGPLFKWMGRLYHKISLSLVAARFRFFFLITLKLNMYLSTAAKFESDLKNLNIQCCGFGMLRALTVGLAQDCDNSTGDTAVLHKAIVMIRCLTSSGSFY